MRPSRCGVERSPSRQRTGHLRAASQARCLARLRSSGVRRPFEERRVGFAIKPQFALTQARQAQGRIDVEEDDAVEGIFYFGTPGVDRA